MGSMPALLTPRDSWALPSPGPPFVLSACALGLRPCCRGSVHPPRRPARPDLCVPSSGLGGPLTLSQLSLSPSRPTGLLVFLPRSPRLLRTACPGPGCCSPLRQEGLLWERPVDGGVRCQRSGQERGAQRLLGGQAAGGGREAGPAWPSVGASRDESCLWPSEQRRLCVPSSGFGGEFLLSVCEDGPSCRCQNTRQFEREHQAAFTLSGFPWKLRARFTQGASFISPSRSVSGGV